MSAQSPIRRITAPQIRARKGGEPIVSLTSYHAHTAAIVDKYADFILVGDSLGMVMHGMDSTIGVPLDLMIMHGKAVVRGTQRALIVVEYALRHLRGKPANGVSPCRQDHEGNRLRRGQAGRWRAYGRDHSFLSERGIPRHGAYRADPAIGEHHGRVQGG